MRLAYQRAYVELLGFVRTAAQKHGTTLYPRRPEVIATDAELLVAYWMAGHNLEYLKEIAAKTECTEFREDFEWLLTLPNADKRDL